MKKKYQVIQVKRKNHSFRRNIIDLKFVKHER